MRTLELRLAKIELLAGLPETELRALEGRCRWRRYRADDLIFDREGETRDLLFVVEGKVQVVNYAASGREVIYGVIGSGDYFGELAAIDGEPRSASVIAVEDCLLAALPPQSLHDLLLRHGGLALAVLRRLARTIRQSDDRIVDLSTLSSIQRVDRELLRLARAVPGQEGRWVVDPLPTQRALAARAGTARETVARALSHLAQEDIAQRRGRSLFILDRARLERRVLSPAVDPALITPVPCPHATQAQLWPSPEPFRPRGRLLRFARESRRRRARGRSEGSGPGPSA